MFWQKRKAEIRLIGKKDDFTSSVFGTDEEISMMLTQAIYRNMDFLPPIISTVFQNAGQYYETGEDYIYQVDFQHKTILDVCIVGSKIKSVVRGTKEDMTTLLGCAAGTHQEIQNFIVDTIFEGMEIDRRRRNENCVFEPQEENKIMCKHCERHKSQHWK